MMFVIFERYSETDQDFSSTEPVEILSSEKGFVIKITISQGILASFEVKHRRE